MERLNRTKDKKEDESQKTEQKDNNTIEQRWKERKKGAFIIALVVTALDILALALGTTIDAVPVALSIGCVGIITFVGMLTVSNYLSRDPALSKNEMRKAIASAFTLVYLVLLALVFFGGLSSAESELARTIVGHFTWIVGIVIVFYFGSRPVEEYLKKNKQKDGEGKET